MYRLATPVVALSCLLLVCHFAAVAGQKATSDKNKRPVFSDKFEAARVHFQKGRIEEALEVYEQLRETAAVQAKVSFGLSQVYQAQVKWKEATQVLNQTVKAVPKDARLWARLAEVQFLQGRYRAAEESSKTAIQIEGDQVLARLVLADVHLATGRIKEADDAYRWFVRFYNRAQPEDAETLLWV